MSARTMRRAMRRQAKPEDKSDGKITPVLIAESLMLLAYADGIQRDYSVAFAVGDDEIAKAHRMVLADEIDGYLAVWATGGKLEILARARQTELDERLAGIVNKLSVKLDAMRVAKAEQWTTWRDVGGAA